tara:strand:- start:335 stop:553 length:219 start_codon:yes stop_codon:yes gene_type:complete
MSKRGDTSTFDALKRQRIGELDRLIKMPGMPANEVNMLKTQRKRVMSAKDMNSLRMGSAVMKARGGTFKGTF